MRSIFTKLLALILVLTMLLTGCATPQTEDSGTAPAESQPATTESQPSSDTQPSTDPSEDLPEVTHFSEMEYVRPDMEYIEGLFVDCSESSVTEQDVEVLLEKIWDCYNAYNSFYTQYNLANIYYFKDMTVTYWEEEYNYCMDQTAQMDAWLDDLFYTLADSPLREELEASDDFEDGFFDDYDGESIWDETFTALMNRQSEMESQYYELCAAAQNVDPYSEEFYNGYGAQMAQLFVELIALRQEIAAYAGYEDYLSFAFEFNHGRDYTPAQAQAYLEQIEQELVPLYRASVMKFVYNNGWDYTTDDEVFSYVKSAALDMGGSIEEAFRVMEAAELYDIAQDSRKYEASFEVYLTDYSVPYLFVSPQGVRRDKLTFAHEFGHFCKDYVLESRSSGVDVMEVFSQAMEYLSVCYGEDAGELQEVKMLDSLSTFVEQSAYALFEQKVYALEGDELTVENVQAIYEQVGTDFGFDIWQWDSRDYVNVLHFYVAPLYIISYVLSNDVAMQIYELEKEESGKGLAFYENAMLTEQPTLIAFVEETGLVSPFAEGRIQAVRDTLKDDLKIGQKAAA